MTVEHSESPCSSKYYLREEERQPEIKSLIVTFIAFEVCLMSLRRKSELVTTLLIPVRLLSPLCRGFLSIFLVIKSNKTLGINKIERTFSTSFYRKDIVLIGNILVWSYESPEAK